MLHSSFEPALKSGNAYLNDRPILTTFLAIFFALSVLPVLAFVGIALFVIVSFTLTALVVAFVASSAVILGSSAILALILLGAFFTSAFFTFVVISSYLFLRLFVLVRQDGVSGISGWACEIKSHVLNIGTRAQDNQTNKNDMVHEPEPRSSDYHDEGDFDVKVQG